MSAAASEAAGAVIRELIPAHGWILQPRIVELATLLLLACGEMCRLAEERWEKVRPKG